MKTQTKIIRTLIIVLNTVFLNAFSQDTIMIKDGNVLISKVLEISKEEIRFKKFENLEGPTYIENKTNVIRIKYKNGSKEEFKFEKPWLAPSQSSVDPVPELKKYPRLSKSGNIYFHGNNRKTEGEMQREMLLLNNIDLNDHIHKAKMARGLQYIGFAAIPFAIAGSLYTLSSAAFDSNSTMNTAGALFGLAAISIGTSIHFKVQRNRHNAEIVRIYNQTY